MEVTVVPSRPALCLPMSHPSQVGEARRMATSLAGELWMSDVMAGHLAIIATEAGNNLVRHAKDGVLLLQTYVEGGAPSVEVLAIDKGPGMDDVTKCMRDGYSTIGTAGQGLGAISRLADCFDIYSQPGKGTVLVARVRSDQARQCASRGGMTYGVVSLPNRGEELCGDSWAIGQGAGRVLAMVVDGLGHGPIAAEAAGEARRIFLANLQNSAQEILELSDAALRKTRGAAMAIAEINAQSRTLAFAGLGNIGACVWSQGASRGMVSVNGIVGHGSRRLSTYTYPFPEGALLMMYSDGISSRWATEGYPGVTMRHPAILAGLAVRDFSRGRDDATVVVMKDV